MRIFASILLCYLFILSIVPAIADTACYEEVACCDNHCPDSDSDEGQENKDCGMCNPLMQCTCYNVFFISSYSYTPEINSEVIIQKSTYLLKSPTIRAIPVWQPPKIAA